MAKDSTRCGSLAAGVVGLAVVFALPSTAQATTRTIGGGAGVDVIRHIGRAYNGATLELVACVNGSWVFYGTLSTSDQVVVTGSTGDDTIEFERSDGWKTDCGDDVDRYVWEFTSGGCPYRVYAYGGADEDTVAGSDCADILYGGDDTDHVYGHYGNDFVFGDDGNDFVWGDGDADRIYGGEGDDDEMYGGDSYDCLSDDACSECDCQAPAYGDTHECTGACSQTNCESYGCLTR